MSNILFCDKNFIGYTRVSTKEQTVRGTNEIQDTNIKNIAKIHGSNLEKIYFDASKSGWILNTVEFKEMLNHLEKVDGLYIEHNDRFFRGDPNDPTSMIDALNIYREIFKKGKIVFSIQEGQLKMDTLTDVLLMSVKTYESSNRIIIDKKKQKDGIKRYKKKHARWGPFQKKLNINQYQGLRNKGLSKTACAKLMGMSRTTLNRLLHSHGIDDFEKFKIKSI